MTLAGVMVTLKHERNIHQYEKSLESIDKEREALGKAICDLNVFAPSTIYQQFNSLQITNKGYDSAQVAAIRQQLFEEMGKINALKLETMFMFQNTNALRSQLLYFKSYAAGNCLAIQT